MPKLHIFLTDNRKDEDRKCSGCNNQTYEYYGLGTTEKNAIDRNSGEEGEEEYGNGQCAFCLIEELMSGGYIITENKPSMRKPCAICRAEFTVLKNARTADTRTLCVKCRKTMNEDLPIHIAKQKKVK